ncbi:MAG: helix-turn-helix transcriptional regulator [Polyangiales bacterium]
MAASISARRKALKLTQQQLAALAGVAQSVVSEAESGTRPNQRKYSDILAALDKAESENGRNSSGNTERGAPVSATQAPAMPHLTLVSPLSQVAQPAAAATTPVDRALSLAFDGRRHVLADAYAVHPIAARLPLEGRPEGEMVTVFRSYLDAAARLRERGTPATIEALLAELTFARG